ncbi:MAG: YqaJ viral recombinase family protein [Betaproteobacteria bacterium]|nr:YqaJ viral recombinase family protein [Betaproteobacteria bacterium]
MSIQGSPEWALERCGNATASEFAAILAKGEKKVRTGYLRRLVAERLTGKPVETYTNWQMQRGQEQEPFARASYEAVTGNLVEQVGFLKHPMMACGASPDGLIGIEGGCEIKSVIPTVQLNTILAGKYPQEHTPQIQGNLWIAGVIDKVEGRAPRKWWDFCSYSADMPDHLRTYIFRIERDEEYIKMLNQEVILFLVEVDQLVAKLNERKVA